MFFDLRFNKILGTKRVAFTKGTSLVLPEVKEAEYIRQKLASDLICEPGDGDVICEKLEFSLVIPEKIRAEIEKEVEITANVEEYAIVVGKESYIYATDERAFIFGFVTLLSLFDNGECEERIVYDYPESSVRGYRMYMPGRESVDDFKKAIDFIAYYKYNTVILEVGGAMEYKKHPEINEKWVEFCSDVRRYSGRSHEIQMNTYPWKKNSIHSDNGEGSYLTQDECRELVSYCNSRGLEVIPECPTLSHCDYLVMAHPEIAERSNDNWPDTYCPNHPDTYPLVFDILDEVIDVFKPKAINIGHDEFYTVCICPRCKDSAPADVYVNDIVRISDYLRSKSVSTLMWGEKLLRVIDPRTGLKYGGWDSGRTYPDGTFFKVPDLYECADKLPRDILILNWYWSFGAEYDSTYHNAGYKMILANFNVLQCDRYRERIKWGALGAVVSNWGSNEDEYMQRNAQYYSLIASAYALWSADYDSDKKSFLTQKTVAEAFRKHYHGKKHLIKVVHTAKHSIPYKVFYDGVFIEDDLYMLGHYELTYEDGTVASLPVKYGTNITSSDPLGTGSFDIPDCAGTSSFAEVSSSTLPRIIDGELYCECLYENPYPEKTVASTRYVPESGKENIVVITKAFEA